MKLSLECRNVLWQEMLYTTLEKFCFLMKIVLYFERSGIMDLAWANIHSE